jgi:hypothetical protein
MATFVYSTITNPTEYCEWLDGGNEIKRKGRSVIIKGGAGLPRKRTLETPFGISTEVSDEEIDFLEKLPAFQLHMKRGFLTVVKGGRKSDADKVAADMSQRDGCAPMVPNDYADKKLPVQMGSEQIVTEPTTAPRYKPKIKEFGN